MQRNLIRKIGRARYVNVKQKVQKYCEQAGWDKDGIITNAILKRLNLNDVDEALSLLRK